MTTRSRSLSLSRCLALGYLALGCLALGCLGLGAACGGDTGTSGAAASSATLTRFCTTRCAWKARCSSGSASCQADCVAEGNPLLSILRDSYLAGAAGCFETLVCGGGDDLCMQHYQYADAAYPNVGEVQRCLSRRQECNNSFSDDPCLAIAALVSSARASADACRAQACDAVGACLRVVEKN